MTYNKNTMFVLPSSDVGNEPIRGTRYIAQLMVEALCYNCKSMLNEVQQKRLLRNMMHYRQSSIELNPYSVLFHFTCFSDNYKFCCYVTMKFQCCPHCKIRLWSYSIQISNSR